MRLAVVVPSRGLIFSETVEEIVREVLAVGCEWRLFFAHSQPIPDCFNVPAVAGLSWGATHVWFAEEDMVFPPGVLGELLASGADVAAADYPLRGGGMCVARDGGGVVMFTGTGCLLAQADVLSGLLPFDASRQYELHDSGWVRAPAAAGSYGLHDVDFGMRLYASGRPVHVIDTVCGQRYVQRRAVEGSNTDGWHEIRTL